MPIEFRCSQCNQLLRVPDDAAGKSARCPKCQVLMAVPAASVAEVASSVSAPPELGIASPAPAVSPAPESPFGQNPFASEEASFPAPPVAKQTFGEAAPNLNPYAAPGMDSYAVAFGQYPWGRTGLPWETEPRTLGCWFRTLGVILGSPTRAFSIMLQSGGMGIPIKFAFYGTGMPLGLLMVMAIPVVILIILFAGGWDNPAMAIGGGAAAVVGILVVVVLYALLLAVVGNLIGAAIWHLFLMLFGAARHGFETTFRVTSYVNGSLIWLNFIPYIGGCIAGPWTLVLLVIGFSKAHEVPVSKALLAVLSPLAFCIGLYLLFVIGALITEGVRQGVGG